MDPRKVYELEEISTQYGDWQEVRSMLQDTIKETKNYSSVVRKKTEARVEEKEPLGHAIVEDQIVVWGRSLWGMEVGIPELHSRINSRWPAYDTYCTCGNQPHLSSPKSEPTSTSSSFSLSSGDSGFSDEQKNSAWCTSLWESWVFRSILIYEKVESILLKREADWKRTHGEASVPRYFVPRSIENSTTENTIKADNEEESQPAATVQETPPKMIDLMKTPSSSRETEAPLAQHRQYKSGLSLNAPKEYLSIDKTETKKKVYTPKKADMWWDQSPSPEAKDILSLSGSLSIAGAEDVEESEFDEWWQRVTPSPEHEKQVSPSPTPTPPPQPLVPLPAPKQEPRSLLELPLNYIPFENHLQNTGIPRHHRALAPINHVDPLYPIYPILTFNPTSIPLYPPVLPLLPTEEEMVEMALCLSDPELSEEFMGVYHRMLPFYRRWFRTYNVHF